MADVLIDTRLLTAHQVTIANGLCALLEGVEYADAFPAMVSILAASINGAADTNFEALTVATAIGDELIDLVEHGQAGLVREA